MNAFGMITVNSQIIQEQNKKKWWNVSAPVGIMYLAAVERLMFHKWQALRNDVFYKNFVERLKSG